MKYIILILLLSILTVYGQVIKNIYFDTATRLLSFANGAVVVDLNDGRRGTICMNSVNNTNVAIVACRMMNYNIQTSGPSAVAYISSKKSTFATTHFQGLTCLGTETSLDQCSNFQYRDTVDFRCRNNNQDLSVYCLHSYTFSTDKANTGICQGTANTTGLDTQNILILKYNGISVSFCGVLNQFGTNEAKLFCKMLCRNDTYARIVKITNSTGISVIGGFKSLSCPPNAVSLADCNNSFPFERNECMPSDSISVSCDLLPLAPSTFPAVICGRNFLTLQWNLSINSNLRSGDVSIMYRNLTCPTAIVTNNSIVLNLTVSLNDCNNDASGDASNIIYTFNVRRTYPQVDGATVISDQIFQTSCYIIRNGTVSQGPISINPSSINGGSNTANILTDLQIFRDSLFTNVINDLVSIAVGTTIFVRVRMIDPPINIVLVLITCQIESSTTSIILINNRCPVATYNVQINPISDSVASFNFQSFSIADATSLRIVCTLSKCGKNEIGCSTRC